MPQLTSGTTPQLTTGTMPHLTSGTMPQLTVRHHASVNFSDFIGTPLSSIVDYMPPISLGTTPYFNCLSYIQGHRHWASVFFDFLGPQTGMIFLKG